MTGRGMAAAGVVLLAVGVLAGVALLVPTLHNGVQVPDALGADGEPCCGVPDTWGDAVGAVVVAAVLAALLGLAVPTAASLVAALRTGTWPGVRHRALAAAVPVAVLAVVTAVSWSTGEAHPGRSCEDVDLASVPAVPSEGRVLVIEALDRCGRFTGRDIGEVRAAIGRETGGALPGLDRVEGDRVASWERLNPPELGTSVLTIGFRGGVAVESDFTPRGPER